MSKYKNPPRIDASNVAGITTLMNPQHIKNNVNLQQVEHMIMQKNTTVVDDPVKNFTDEINKLANELGVDIFEYQPAVHSSTADTTEHNNTPALINSNHVDNVSIKSRSTDDSDVDEDRDYVPQSNQRDYTSSQRDLVKDYPNAPRLNGYVNAPVSEQRVQASAYVNRPSDIQKDYLTQTQPTQREYLGSQRDNQRDTQRDNHNIDEVIASMNTATGIDLMSDTYKKRYDFHSVHIQPSHKNNVEDVLTELNQEYTTSHGKEREEIHDKKLSKLEQINQLRMTLEEEGMNCASIKNCSMESPIEEIDAVLSVLRLKNDRNRYSTLAEEIILGMAEGIETVFDGTRTIPIVNWSPDYRGYHSTVNIKLHRMRFETSQLVGSVIEKYNISPIMRIIMELLPSFFLYPRQQSKQRNSPGLHFAPKLVNSHMAFANIRESEERSKAD